MPTYIISSQANLYGNITAETPRAALDEYMEALAKWPDTTIAAEACRLVDGIWVAPRPADSDTVRVVNDDGRGESLIVMPEEDAEVELQTALFEYIFQGKAPGSDTPPELLELAVQLLGKLHAHLLGIPDHREPPQE